MDLDIERRDIILKVLVKQLVGMGSLPAAYLKQCFSNIRAEPVREKEPPQWQGPPPPPVPLVIMSVLYQ